MRHASCQTDQLPRSILFLSKLQKSYFENTRAPDDGDSGVEHGERITITVAKVLTPCVLATLLTEAAKSAGRPVRVVSSSKRMVHLHAGSTIVRAILSRRFFPSQIEFDTTIFLSRFSTENCSLIWTSLPAPPRSTGTQSTLTKAAEKPKISKLAKSSQPHLRESFRPLARSTYT